MLRWAGTPWAVGKKWHLPACTAGPDEDSNWLALIPQRCFPLRRQQRGSFESASDANTTGLISETLKSATSSIADTRRIAPSVLPYQNFSNRAAMS